MGVIFRLNSSASWNAPGSKRPQRFSCDNNTTETHACREGRHGHHHARHTTSFTFISIGSSWTLAISATSTSTTSTSNPAFHVEVIASTLLVFKHDFTSSTTQTEASPVKAPRRSSEAQRCGQRRRSQLAVHHRHWTWTVSAHDSRWWCGAELLARCGGCAPWQWVAMWLLAVLDAVEVGSGGLRLDCVGLQFGVASR